MKAFALAMLAMSIMGCSMSRGTTVGSFRETIRKSLNRLLLRTNDDSFVIISDPRTNKYCQFDVREGLFFDLPFLTLSDEEQKRAEIVLAKHGIHESIYCHMYDPTGKEINGWMSFQKNMGNDIDSAIEIVTAVFVEIYKLDLNTPIKIEEN